MIDKPQWKPAKGYKYLRDVSVGELVDTSSGLRAIVVEQTGCATQVIVLRADHHPTNERAFYLGDQRWSESTEVKVIGE
tara:strand:- start:1665 stop:1901 length:237 start_codon:yes stop_codon:yes gene_type:complete